MRSMNHVTTETWPDLSLHLTAVNHSSHRSPLGIILLILIKSNSTTLRENTDADCNHSIVLEFCAMCFPLLCWWNFTLKTSEWTIFNPENWQRILSNNELVSNCSLPPRNWWSYCSLFYTEGRVPVLPPMCEPTCLPQSVMGNWKPWGCGGCQKTESKIVTLSKKNF